MPGFRQLPASSMVWSKNVLGAEVTRLPTNGAVLTVVRGVTGDLVPAHGYSHGSVTYVVSGSVEIDGTVLHAGDGGSYQPSSGGYYAVRFLEDSVYVVARTAADELTLPDIGERAAAHLDA
jgi:hypothetical protein